MPVRIRLARTGVRNHPLYNIVAADSRSPRDGRHLEELGSYNPRPNPLTKLKDVKLRIERVKYWLSVGAQPSSRVAYLLSKDGIIPPLPLTKSSPPMTEEQKEKMKAEKAKKKLGKSNKKGESSAPQTKAAPAAAASGGAAKPAANAAKKAYSTIATGIGASSLVLGSISSPYGASNIKKLTQSALVPSTEWKRNQMPF